MTKERECVRVLECRGSEPYEGGMFVVSHLMIFDAMLSNKWK